MENNEIALDAARYRVLRSHVAPRDVSISMGASLAQIPVDQSIEERIDMLCDQVITNAPKQHEVVFNAWFERHYPKGRSPRFRGASIRDLMFGAYMEGIKSEDDK